MPSRADIATAHRYHVSPRTAARWRRDGIDVANPAAVCCALATMKNPSPAALAAARAELEKLTHHPRPSCPC
jgi:hypothetical protein